VPRLPHLPVTPLVPRPEARRPGPACTLDHVDTETPAKRLRIALDMYEFGEQLQRQRLRRNNPNATEAEVEAEVRAWRLRRPGAPDGDCSGRVSRRFE